MLTLKLKRVMKTGVFAVSFGIASTPTVMSSSSQLDSVEEVDVVPRAFAYRMAGDFSQADRPVDAPLVAVVRTSVLHIMKQQVTAAEYDRCVAEARCMSRPSSESSDPNLPVVQTSWEDATAYASWLSGKTGETWRLPTDEEWFLQRDHDSTTMLYRSPPPATPPCAGSLATKRSRSRRHWISGRALPEPSAQMNTDCSIYRGTSGNGPTPASFGNRLTRWASLPARRSPIVGCESSKANTAPL